MHIFETKISWNNAYTLCDTNQIQSNIFIYIYEIEYIFFIFFIVIQLQL